MPISPKILIVEDQSIVSMDIQNRLKNLNYTIAGTSSSGAGAIKKAEETSPDLVLMDIMLKGDMDGIDAAKQIIMRFDIPIIYITAYADSNTLQRAKITEPFGYILKPFEEKELKATIEMALYRHKMEKKLKEREQWFNSTLKSINDPIITTDKEFNITFVNSTAKKFFDCEENQIIRKNLSDIMKVKKDNFTQVDFLNHHSEDSTAEVKEIIIVKNQEKIISKTISLIKDDDNQTIGYVVLFKDLTEKYKLEQQKIKINLEKSLNDFSFSISNDFNNILTAISGNI
ncbi:MAG: response regulator, partial [Candidatus Sericytochromatia bacterium]|nr:response regulator [Candidatus Sericytochromatia bacterium]